MMHSNRGVNPREPLAQELKAITSKRQKSEEDLDQIAYLEWQLGLYFKPGIGPYLRAEMVHACLRDAGKRSKQGKTVTEAVWIEEQERGIAASVAETSAQVAKPGHVFTGVWLEDALDLGEKPTETAEYEKWIARRARMFHAWRIELLTEHRIHVEEREPRGYVVI